MDNKQLQDYASQIAKENFSKIDAKKWSRHTKENPDTESLLKPCTREDHGAISLSLHHAVVKKIRPPATGAKLPSLESLGAKPTKGSSLFASWRPALQDYDEADEASSAVTASALPVSASRLSASSPVLRRTSNLSASSPVLGASRISTQRPLHRVGASDTSASASRLSAASPLRAAASLGMEKKAGYGTGGLIKSSFGKNAEYKMMWRINRSVG